MYRIIYAQANGVAAVVIPSPNSTLTPDEMAAKTLPPGTPYAVVPVSAISSDRTYRSAWEADVQASSVRVNLPKAREIHKSYLREARTPLLTDLDTQYMRADEAGNVASKAQIAAKKQALRDVTADPAIAAAQTVDELKQVWPSILGPSPLK